MKPLAVLLGISAVVNIGLLSAFALKPDLAPAPVRELFGPSSPTVSTANGTSPAGSTFATSPGPRPASGVASSTGSPATANVWAALNSDDLPSLVKNLRAAGFSRAAILHVLNARLDAQFASRMKTLTADVENAPYWKPDPMNSPNNKYWEEYSQIYRERSRMLRQLLGDDMFAWGGDPAAAQRRQFGSIPKEKIDLVQRINDDYAEMTSQVRMSMQGITLPEDREKIALLEREKRADLAAILTPAELEEYEMRSSPLTSRLRNTLTLMDASEAEFRSIFKVQQAFNERINPTVGGYFSSQMMEDRREAQRQMNEQLKAALPTERYADYLRVSSTDYQTLHRLAQRENVPIETVNRAYALRENVSAESVRIADDSSLSAEQKRAALSDLAQRSRTELLSTLGPRIGENYVQSARWLTSVERGSPFTIGPDGSTISRPIAMPANLKK